jgi:hypothetical protein
VNPNGVHQRQEPVDLFTIDRVEVEFADALPAMAIELVPDPLGHVVGVRLLHPPPLGNPDPAPPAIPEPESDAPEKGSGQKEDPGRHQEVRVRVSLCIDSISGSRVSG